MFIGYINLRSDIELLKIILFGPVVVLQLISDHLQF